MPDDEVWLAYDPFVPEDRAHARRVTGAGVRHLALSHMGHRAIRMVKEIGALDGLVAAIAGGTPDPTALALSLRARRGALPWKRAMLAEAERRGHARLALAAGRRLAALDPGDRFARRFVSRLEGAPAPAPALGGDRLFHVTAGIPAPPFAGAIEHLHRALVLPEREGDLKLASGVLRADGSHAEMSRAWVRARKSTPAPSLLPDEVVTDLPGRHLFAGHFRGHFGHFLVESTARLWALDHLGVKLDSILYLPYRGDHRGTRRAIAGQRAFFDLLGITVPVTAHAGALRVEELYLPELGFGWLDRYAGSPAYRDFMCSRLSAAAPAEGGEKLYISRARLPALRGGILGETVIEENLSRAGFEVFHPERHPLATQIARYKAAREIVALDGSALHLAAYVVAPGTRVSMILRRSSANVADYLLQYRAFAGIQPAVIDAIRCDWVSGGATRADYRSVGEVDFKALFARLAALGHLPSGFSPDLPDEGEIAAMLVAQEDRRGAPFRALAKGERHPDADEEEDAPE
jgi:capsular polysaccharide biosynthesis protein